MESKTEKNLLRVIRKDTRNGKKMKKEKKTEGRRGI